MSTVTAAAVNVYLIVTHIKPHLDEICAIWMLKRWGRKKFPGVTSAKFHFEEGDRAKTLDGDKMLKDGVLAIGIGGGLFDEHPSRGSNGQNGKCAADLVAEYLDIQNKPGLERILKFVRDSDTKTVGHPFDLAILIKDLNASHPKDTEKVINWAILALEAKYEQQVAFLQAQEELQKNSETKEFTGPDGKKVKMVVAKTDDQQFSKAARANGADIVIQQNKSGQVQIYTQKRSGIRMEGVVEMLRREDQRIKGKVVVTDKNQLRREGTLNEVPEWFFHQEGQMVLNGSLSYPKVKATRIPLEKIVDIVEQGVE